MTVRYELEKLGLDCISIELGRVEIIGLLSNEDTQRINLALFQSGLELIENKKQILIEKIKNVIVEMVHYTDDQLKVNFSSYLSLKLNRDYTYLANVFSETEGYTIEQFIIRHKIERVKELIEYNELSLTEISWKLHYSSVAHLSSQFKKVTGLTPSCFKHLEHRSLTTLENV